MVNLTISCLVLQVYYQKLHFRLRQQSRSIKHHYEWVQTTIKISTLKNTYTLQSIKLSLRSVSVYGALPYLMLKLPNDTKSLVDLDCQWTHNSFSLHHRNSYIHITLKVFGNSNNAGHTILFYICTLLCSNIIADLVFISLSMYLVERFHNLMSTHINLC